MSRSPTSPEGLARELGEEGHDVALLGGALVVRSVPYLRRNREIGQGELVVPLALEGDVLVRPRTHTAWWRGEQPFEADGSPLRALNYSARVADPSGSGTAPFKMMCCKPRGREYRDHREFVLTYLAVLAAPVSEIDPTSAATRSRRSVRPPIDTGPFAYLDTASPRVGLGALNERIAGLRIGIVGLGGTGSYVLDLIAKSGVAAIHLFDPDVFEQHSAFRAPGAASIDDLRMRRSKVEHFAETYRAIHRNVVAHEVRVNRRTAPVLDVLDFAFVCIDEAPAKPPILARLVAGGIPFVDVGMGLHEQEGGIAGAIRTTFVAPDHAGALDRIPTIGDPGGPYATNIQLCELNALNASLAVLAFKRHFGFYAGTSRPNNQVFVVADGRLHAEVGPSADAAGDRT